MREGILGNRLESLFDIDGLLGGSLEIRNIAFGLTPRHGAFLRHLLNKSALVRILSIGKAATGGIDMKGQE